MPWPSSPAYVIRITEITRIEQQLAKLTDPLLEARVEFSKLAEA
jgi:hypothetical protein